MTCSKLLSAARLWYALKGVTGEHVASMPGWRARWALRSVVVSAMMRMVKLMPLMALRTSTLVVDVEMAEGEMVQR